jgi:fumarate reductase flavoprotein subunit
VRELARNYVGIDPVFEAFPVRPVVHYMMGGVDTDVDGATPVPGLYAAGECACVSINGANRLGSNSLPECLVFGKRAGDHAVRFAQQGAREGDEAKLVEQARAEASRLVSLRNKKGGEKLAQLRRELNAAMEAGCGVFRDEGSLQACVQSVRQLKGRYADVGITDTSAIFNTEIVQALELGNMLDVAEAVSVGAAARKESRGAHTRSDYSKRDDAQFLKHSLVHFAADGPRLSYSPVTITRWQPEERKY